MVATCPVNDIYIKLDSVKYLGYHYNKYEIL